MERQSKYSELVEGQFFFYFKAVGDVHAGKKNHDNRVASSINISALYCKAVFGLL